MKKTNLKEKLQNWKLGNYFRELSIVTAGVFITLAGTDFINSASPVSYTHLRAHETGRNLVCRLLLEKKKKKKSYDLSLINTPPTKL